MGNSNKKIEQLKDELKDCNTKNTPFFTLDGNQFIAKCIKVYDGDTITIAFKPFDEHEDDDENTYCGNIYKYNIRLAGIDTPEIRSSNPDEKKRALEIRDIMREQILDKFVYIKCGKFDKYGRLLGDIYNEEQTVHYNKWLIDEGYAQIYGGGTKKPFTIHSTNVQTNENTQNC